MTIIMSSSNNASSFNPIDLSLIQNQLVSATEEIAIALRRSSFSTNIKERADFSCAMFLGNGEMIAQAENIPVHLGAMPESLLFVLREIEEFFPGDVYISNSPLRGGTHLPDITAVRPIFLKHGGGHPDFFVVNRAHHADVGGKSPGSMPAFSMEIFEEGLVIPPIRIVKKGELQRDILRLILENMRNPRERKGDLMAQISSLSLGEQRLRQILRQWKLDYFRRAIDELLVISESLMREALSIIPHDPVVFEDYLDSDGMTDDPVKIKASIWRKGSDVHVSFEGSSKQRRGNCNAPAAVTKSATYYVFRCLVDPSTPLNSGCYRPMKIHLPEKSVVNPSWPSATSSGNVETSQRIVDVLLGALSRVDALKSIIPAASQGTMNNLSFGAQLENGRVVTYYETIGGGTGAWKGGHGESGIHSHMTNTKNTPIEAMELELPVRVLQYRLRPQSGGKGRWKGGLGIIRELKFLRSVTVSMQSERRKFSPWGLDGGENGKKGRNLLKSSDQDVEYKVLPGRFTIHLSAGAILRIETPGGGGHGKPRE